MWKILRDPIAAIGGGAIGVAKGLKTSALETSGLAPLASTLSSGGSMFGSRRGRGRGGGRGGGSSKSETGLLNTSLLFQIRDEVQQIKGLLVATAIPESERREKEFEDWRRHRELLSAISGLSGGLGGAAASAKSGGSLGDLLKGLLAITGLAMLPKLLEMVPGIVDGIQNFLNEMGLFLTAMLAVFLGLSVRTKSMKPPKPVKGPGRIRRTALAAKNLFMEREERRLAKEKAKKAKEEKARHKRNRSVHGGGRWRNPLNVIKSPIQEKMTKDPKAAKVVATTKVGAVVTPALSGEEGFKERGRQNIDAKRIADERVTQQKNKLQLANEQRAKVKADLERDKQQQRKNANATKNRIAFRMFQETGQVGTKAQIAKSYASDPQVLKGIVDSKINNLGKQLTLIGDDFKNLKARVGLQFAEVNRKFILVNNSITTISDNVRKSLGLKPAARALSKSGVSMAGVKLPSTPDPALKPSRPDDRQRGGRTDREGGKPPPPATTPKMPSTGSGRTPGDAKGKIARVIAGHQRWVTISNTGKMKIDRLLGSTQLRVGGALLGGAAVAVLAFDQYGEYYRNTYIPAMQKAGAQFKKKGKVVAQFDPNNPQVKAARQALWQKMIQIGIIMGAAIGSGALGALIGGKIGFWIGSFMAAFSLGVGAALIPIATTAGALVGGVAGFSLSMIGTDTNIGDMATDTAAQAAIANLSWLEQNETGMRWAENVFTLMVTAENAALRGWAQTGKDLGEIGYKMMAQGVKDKDLPMVVGGAITGGAGRLLQGTATTGSALASIPDKVNEGAAKAFGKDADAQRKGFKDFDHYLQTSFFAASRAEMGADTFMPDIVGPEEPIRTPTVLPQQKLMSMKKRRALLSMMMAKRDQTIAFLAKNPKHRQKAAKIKLIDEAQRAIEQLLNAPLDSEGTSYIINHREIKDARVNNTTVTQSTTSGINFGSNMAFDRSAGSGRY